MTDHTRDELDALGETLGANMATLGDCGLPSEAELSATLAAIAPCRDDFGGSHYVFYDATIDYQLPAAVLAIACRGLDIALRDRIKKTTGWRGRGPAIVLNRLRIFDHVADAWQGDPFEMRQHCRKKAIALTIHEAAHYLETPIDRDEPAESEIFDRAVHTSEKKFKSWSSRDYRLPEGPRWKDHGFQFVRALCHLVGRFEMLGGERFPRHFAFNHDGYELFPLGRYVEALGDEIATLRDEPFATIRATPAPSSYVETFRDSLHWWARFSDDPEAAPLHIATELAPHIRAGLNAPSGR
jgi:hypothetical protein